ncbi:MAG: type II toxin-antitoxin system RelE family toxin [Candidatus Nanoarchaeia archaeon]
MKFELKINSQPLKFLKKIEPVLKERIKSKLKLLEENSPSLFGTF